MTSILKFIIHAFIAYFICKIIFKQMDKREQKQKMKKSTWTPIHFHPQAA